MEKWCPDCPFYYFKVSKSFNPHFLTKWSSPINGKCERVGRAIMIHVCWHHARRIMAINNYFERQGIKETRFTTTKASKSSSCSFVEATLYTLILPFDPPHVSLLSPEQGLSHRIVSELSTSWSGSSVAPKKMTYSKFFEEEGKLFRM